MTRIVTTSNQFNVVESLEEIRQRLIDIKGSGYIILHWENGKEVYVNADRIDYFTEYDGDSKWAVAPTFTLK